jgi:hypothetical protein
MEGQKIENRIDAKHGAESHCVSSSFPRKRESKPRRTSRVRRMDAAFARTTAADAQLLMSLRINVQDDE